TVLRLQGDGGLAAGDQRDRARCRCTRQRSMYSGHGLCIAADTVRHQHGRGGRNTEFLLALALDLAETPAWAIACDTDGIDGSEDHAGALIGPDTLARAQAQKLDAAACLAAHDSHGFFSALGDLVVSGPTRTNVNDYRALLVGLDEAQP
ncbi:MAG: MOFRL family protein, partial [Thiobacillus sp.]|nr:MOFRL family protein [Thiobacillus sp.]